MPVRTEDTAISVPEPYRSIHRPTNGVTTTAHRPPRLTAPEKSARDQPSCSVIGTTNTDRVATAMTVRVEKLTTTVLAIITQP